MFGIGRMERKLFKPVGVVGARVGWLVLICQTGEYSLRLFNDGFQYNIKMKIDYCV